MIFPQNVKSEGEPGNSLNWKCSDFKAFDRTCNNGTHVIICDWDPEAECCPQWQDLCPED